VKPVRADDLFACLSQISQTPTQAAQVTARPESLTNVKKCPHVLIVEDVAMNRILVCELVKKLISDAVVIEATNGREAIDRFQRDKFDLIFMDIQMPVLDGYSASCEIRRIEAASAAARTPIVALTASAVKGEYEKCIAAGMDEFITKPVDPHHFTRIFQTYLKM
ncbi:MAG TPA: response regulator, partial [Candidatus Rifleibacterium sp.]|nr:response regulator [Candidatus Rifleibacterium sp.]